MKEQHIHMKILIKGEKIGCISIYILFIKPQFAENKTKHHMTIYMKNPKKLVRARTWAINDRSERYSSGTTNTCRGEKHKLRERDKVCVVLQYWRTNAKRKTTLQPKSDHRCLHMPPYRS